MPCPELCLNVCLLMEIISAHTGMVGKGAEVSGVTAGCGEVLNPGRAPALPQAPSLGFGRGHIDPVSPTPSGETRAEAPGTC